MQLPSIETADEQKNKMKEDLKAGYFSHKTEMKKIEESTLALEQEAEEKRKHLKQVEMRLKNAEYKLNFLKNANRQGPRKVGDRKVDERPVWQKNFRSGSTIDPQQQYAAVGTANTQRLSRLKKKRVSQHQAVGALPNPSHSQRQPLNPDQASVASPAKSPSDRANVDQVAATQEQQ